ncbi:helix-turn-helix domain-containing protein [Agaribacterium sp. ZY112]|uniref:helix-turn-helix domain-containing protein n=1 Tax=Agaribacterium sp. ZY112 TaxID=3233574 RepID=UPI0035246639
MKAQYEHIAAGQQQSFYSRNYQAKSFNSPWHYHPQWELTYIKKGEGLCYVGNSIRPFASGELVLVGSMLPHCWKSDETAGRVESIFAQWDDGLLGKDWLQQPELTRINKLLKDSDRGLIFSQTLSEELGRKLEMLCSLPPFDSLIALLRILQSLANSDYSYLSEGQSLSINANSSERIEKILQFVEQHYQQDIQIEQLCELCNMTQSSFARFFKRSLDKPFSHYLSEYRVNRASNLLKSSELSIEAIAYDVGFRNMSYFHRQFKKTFNSTPANYRRSFQAL